MTNAELLGRQERFEPKLQVILGQWLAEGFVVVSQESPFLTCRNLRRLVRPLHFVRVERGSECRKVGWGRSQDGRRWKGVVRVDGEEAVE